MVYTPPKIGKVIENETFAGKDVMKIYDLWSLLMPFIHRFTLGLNPKKGT